MEKINLVKDFVAMLIEKSDEIISSMKTHYINEEASVSRCDGRDFGKLLEMLKDARILDPRIKGDRYNTGYFNLDEPNDVISEYPHYGDYYFTNEHGIAANTSIYACSPFRACFWENGYGFTPLLYTYRCADGWIFEGKEVKVIKSKLGFKNLVSIHQIGYKYSCPEIAGWLRYGLKELIRYSFPS